MRSDRCHKRSTSAKIVAAALLLVPWQALACGHGCCGIDRESAEVRCPAGGIADSCRAHQGDCAFELVGPLLDVPTVSDANRLEGLATANPDRILVSPALRQGPPLSGSGGASVEAPLPFPGGQVPSTFDPRPPPRMRKVGPYAFRLPMPSTRPSAPIEPGRCNRAIAISARRGSGVSHDKAAA